MLKRGTSLISKSDITSPSALLPRLPPPSASFNTRLKTRSDFFPGIQNAPASPSSMLCASL